ncbi:hypothetical protein [Glycomyces sp. YM15]|uniref:hypothetical protein n=1 Tax=Glycomyces sp. YM15 TaxID=2800446 RepID=UPI001965D7C3|nr:hypothetical protein [Glycomyces sp. YM15]
MPADLLATIVVSAVTAAAIVTGIFYTRYRIAYRRERARAGHPTKVTTTRR